ncbi:alpha-glucan family phosphorylase [Kiritimatiella glycovorans]|uniref:Maltodextrin phosphorylase n=1 Tax=Kiritimatiella glycovorans TaxID=1307763 RepID=A0A0G3EBA0_9BACT|nr:alpha-glucan family phosphorylase [Kiritimatiella glycovorans]AKJ63771.1 Maltodextrin phosphorylase [Kiritimatiella glycovorans]
MNGLQLFNVAPAVPEPVRFLETLTRNLWWSWHPDAQELFRRIDPHLWRQTGHNPLAFLSGVDQRRLEKLADDEGFLEHQRQVRERFELEVESVPAEEESCRSVAYFSLEYGIHESMKIYSGGLGVLAGDHLKAASDMRLPMVAVGLLYRQGYFEQYLNSEAWQQEHYPENEVQHLPVQKVFDESGHQIEIELPLPDGMLRAVVWRLEVGRIPVYLLDANLPGNPPPYREVTAQLYGGGRETRLRQELLLGIGGYRALLAAGYRPHVCHINEGHAAFLSLARLAHLTREEHLEREAAIEVVSRTNVFTTHTPVPAGNEVFRVDLLRPHLEALEEQIGIPADEVIAWGSPPHQPEPAELSMTILGLRMSHFNNGVSELHGSVARRMWSFLWPKLQEDEVPITHVTNGVHIQSWLAPEMAQLFDRYLGPQWRWHPGDPEVLAHIEYIPDDELWRAHEVIRSRLIRTARERMTQQYQRRNATRAELAQARSVLDHDALTIGFARRFATYKRATLLLRDPDRLLRLLGNDERPVQLVFAGKAHPADEGGKRLIRELVDFARRAEIRMRMIFLEDYDMYVARRLVQGVDVWLNTPRRPLEASGTSGMKAAVNGGLNVSTLDGWWCEGYARENGWAIGRGVEYEDLDYQDSVESQALYNLLEDEIIPAFYDRPLGDLPGNWVKMMKASIHMVLGRFTSHRMLAEYQDRFYRPGCRDFERLTEEGARGARTLVEQRRRFEAHWHEVSVEDPVADRNIVSVHVGDSFAVSTRVNLGSLDPEDVDIQLYFGPVDSHNRMTRSEVRSMELEGGERENAHRYRQEVTCRTTGRFGFTARAVPKGDEWRKIMPGFITWAGEG